MDTEGGPAMECTHIFWHECSQCAGITLGLVLPLILGFSTVMLTSFRLQHRHEAAMQEARLRADQVRESLYRVIQGGQG
jgi:hypothetical protein